MTAFASALVAGRLLFKRGSYFAAHEAWEAAWHTTHGDERRVLQALVLWAAAMHQHTAGRTLGAGRLLERALERLGAVRDGFGGLDLEALRDALVRALSAVRAGGAPPRWLEVSAEAPEGLIELDHRRRCPSCGEPVLVAIAPEDAADASYVEDCPVCCRPWQVRVAQGQVSLDRDDA